MPKVKRRRSCPRRRPKRRARRRITISRNVVPDSKVVRHRYCSNINIDPGIGSAANYLFRANSVFDPDYTGIGHQPLGYDQLGVFYDHYVVMGAKITAKFVSLNTDGALGSAVVGIMLKDNASPLTNPTGIIEQSRSGYRIMTNSRAQGLATVTSTYSPRKFFGIKDISDNRSLLGANLSSNPPEDAYFHVFAAPLDPAINTSGLSVLITIEYLVKYTERKTLVQS